MLIERTKIPSKTDPLHLSYHRSIELESGRLDITVRRAEWPPEDLCGFASRHNPSRGFLFVSKVLGKHYPVRPSVMTNLYADLAERLAGLPLPEPVVMVALAETSTGLGQGVFEASLTKNIWRRVVFLPTTRYFINKPVALQIEETHCHAPTHLVYEPAEPSLRQWFHQAATLVLVDDEMSTGKTLMSLARAFQNQNPELKNVVLVTITNWLGQEEQEDLAADFPAEVDFVSILEGSFTFSQKPGWTICRNFKSVGNWTDKSWFIPRDSGRLGLGPKSPQPDLKAWRRSLKLDENRPVLVLGSGEFLYQPYRLAALLEDEGFDTVCQATTRTPIATGGAIEHILRFPDNYDEGLDNFLYNVRPDDDRQIVLAYETAPLSPEHDLPATLKANILFFL